MKPFHVYILRCGDGSYYAGHTDNLDARVMQHHDGLIGYTATRKPVKLVWQGEFESREGAIAFEQQIKGWSRVKKEALIVGDWERIQELAASKKAATSKHLVAARPGLVEGLAGLRQAQPERSGAQGERPDGPIRRRSP